MNSKEAEKRQLKIYRQMSGADRLRIGLELGDLTMELSRQNQEDKNLTTLKLKNGRTNYPKRSARLYRQVSARS